MKNSDKGKSAIRHEVLNLFTLLNFQVAGSTLEESAKEEMLDYLKKLILLINYQDVFLGEKHALLKRDIDLKEILEVVEMIYERKLKLKKVRMTLPTQSLIIKVDRKFAQEGLELIIKKLMEQAKKIEISIDKKALKIQHDSSDILKDGKINLTELVSDDFSYPLAVRLLEATGAKLTCKKGLIKIDFK